MNKQDITNLINSTIIDNDNGLITAETMRNVLNAINDYEPPIADELGRGDNAISQKTVTEEFDEVNTNIETLSTNVNLQVQELSDEVEGKVIEIDRKIKEFSDDVDSEIDRLNQNVQDSLDSYLPINGGRMQGNIDMNGKRIDNVGIEEVDELPTFNLYEGRLVRFKNKTFTFYNGLWLSLSDDLRGRSNDTHEENFIYQPTAADLSVKDGFADIKKLKGNTLVWNQLDRTKGGTTTDNGLTFSWNNGVLTINGTATADSTFYGVSHGYNGVIKNRKAYRYLSVSGDFTGSDNSFVTHSLDFELQYLKLFFNSTTKVTKNIFSAMSYTYFSVRYSIGDIFSNVKIQSKLIDLTQMFGEGNEPATVEEFEAMFPNDYYEYNEGELMSFDGKGLKSVGFNQFDKTKAKIGVALDDVTGDEVISAGSWCSDFVRILPNTKYHISHVIGNYLGYPVHYYDDNFNHIKGVGLAEITQDNGNEDASGTFTTPANAVYIRFRGFNSIGYDNVCLNLSHSGYRNGDYEPYEDYKIPFQEGKTISQLTGKLNGKGESVTIFPDGLRSAGTAYDEIVYDEATGKHKAIKRIGERSYITGDETDTNVTTDKTYTYYKLAEPEIYELVSDIITSYEAYDFGTEEVLYSDENAVNIPMKADIEYGFNAVDMIRSNFAEIKALKKRVTALEQAILQIQAANTANEQIE